MQERLTEAGATRRDDGRMTFAQPLVEAAMERVRADWAAGEEDKRLSELMSTLRSKYEVVVDEQALLSLPF